MTHSAMTRATTIRAAIVDDEELARRGIELRLQAHPDIVVIAQCANGREALAMAAQEAPDLIFLDVQMPGLSGFQVVKMLPQDAMPLIVFVTAYDRYALDAFDAQALDYLMKPVDQARLAQTLERVRRELQQKSLIARHEQMLKLLEQVEGASHIDRTDLIAQLRGLSEPRYATVLPIRANDETVRLPVAQIDWIDAAGDYMCIHAQGNTYVLRETMKALEALLDPARFARVHRSTIVNIDRVSTLRPHMNGEFFLILSNGQELKLSRSYRDRLEQMMDARR
jgi:two-component system, LytTR family, response regulator